jgi:hypothetical protein
MSHRHQRPQPSLFLLPPELFEDLEAARSYFDEQSLRYTWESDPDRPRLGVGLVVREAAKAEVELWRAGRADAIKSSAYIGLDMNPELYIGLVTHGR